jgi:hypothetical protein
MPRKPKPEKCNETGLYLYQEIKQGKPRKVYVISQFSDDFKTAYVYAPRKTIPLKFQHPYLFLPNGKRTTRWNH